VYFANIRNISVASATRSGTTSTASTAYAATRVAVIGAGLVTWVVLIREAGVATVGTLFQRTLAVGASRGSGVFTTRCPIIILSTTISFAICINRMPVRITNQTIGKFCWISRFTPFHRIINVTTFGVVSYTLTCQ